MAAYRLYISKSKAMSFRLGGYSQQLPIISYPHLWGIKQSVPSASTAIQLNIRARASLFYSIFLYSIAQLAIAAAEVATSGRMKCPGNPEVQEILHLHLLLEGAIL